MSIQAQVKADIEQFPRGNVFSYGALPVYRQTPSAVVKAVNRLVQSGELRRLSKGNFYRPRQGKLGEQPLRDEEKLKPFMYRNGRRIGYITGVSLYSRLGLTSQLPRTITLARQGSRMNIDLATFRLRIVTARAPVSESNIPLLELLDALQDIRTIPDTRPDRTLTILMIKIGSLPGKARKELARQAIRYYSPSTRALLGMLYEKQQEPMATALRQSLNPLSRYRVGLTPSEWPAAASWKIE